MRKLPYPLLALLLVFSVLARAQDVLAAPHYIDPAQIDLKALLPDPPANGSPTTLKEIDLILKDQAARTPEQVARIQQEVHLNVYLFQNVLGPWFTEKNLPFTAVLFDDVGADIHPVIESAKKYWDRPRPFLQDKRIHPPIDLPKNASYPSGHSTVGNLDALILVQLAPDLKNAILARGRQIGEDRVIAGVHFPSDVAAGVTLAHDLFDQLMASPVFRDDLMKAKAEIAAARAGH
ncbi:MAG: phosphatase PAP2 family protein [Methylacidiphilales bacterium]|nr:phosphatase PAP2 family protein [Candidatus Methylacidiphilales bacterium]